MSILIKHIWRNIKSNRFRSILVIFSIALSAAVFYINLNIEHDVTASSATILQGVYKDYDISVTGDIGDRRLTLPECEKKLYLQAIEGKIGENDALIFIGDIDRIIDDGLLSLDETSDVKSVNTLGLAVMPRTKALYFGIEPGDIFSVTVGDFTDEFTLAAYTNSSPLFSSGDAATGEVFIYKPSVDANVLLLALTDDSEVDEACGKLTRKYDELTVSTLYSTDGAGDQIRSIRRILSIVLLLVIAITFFVVGSTNSLILNYRIPVIGTFRSIGATARETNLLLIGESFICGMAAAIPGVILGELTRTFLDRQYLGVAPGEIRAAYVLMVPAFAVLMNVGISLSAIIRMGRTPIKELMFRKQSAAVKPSVIGGVIGFVLIFASFAVAYFNRGYNFALLTAELVLAVSGMGLCTGVLCSLFSKAFSAVTRFVFGGAPWLGVRNLEINRIDRSTSLLVAIVISLVMMIYICVSSISGFFASYADNYPYDILIKAAVGPEEDFRYIGELDGVNSVVYEYWDINDSYIDGKEIHVTFVAKDGYSSGIEVDGTLADGLQDGEIIIDYLFADMYGYDVGDRITIRPHQDSEGTFTGTVAGFCESGVFNSRRSSIMMTRSDFFSYIEIDPAIIGVYTSQDVYEMISEINDATAAHDGKLYRVTAKKDYVDSEITDAMSAVNAVSVVPVLTFLLALCGLVNNQLISFNQKRMLYAVLYSTVMSRKQLRKMILTELMSSFIVGCSVGLLISLWLTKIMRDIIFINIAYLPMVVTARQIGTAILLLLALMTATAVFPLSYLKKMDIVKEIKYE